MVTRLSRGGRSWTLVQSSRSRPIKYAALSCLAALSISTCVARCCVSVGYSLRTLATLSHCSACDYSHLAFTMDGYLPSLALFVLPLRAYAVGASLVFVVAYRHRYTCMTLFCFWLVLLSPSLCLSLTNVSSYQ